MQAVVDRLFAAYDPQKGIICGQVEVKEGRLPFRPIVFGGDDVTVVCDGRLGLGLAAAYLGELNGKELSDGKRLVCRAGVAIVKAHYPFARAYDLAEELCASAKREIQSIKTTLENKARKKHSPLLEWDVSTIDWHVATTGLALGLEDIRLREYKVLSGDLSARPVYTYLKPAANEDHPIESFPGKWRSWENFLCSINEFKSGETWAESHNKVKALRQSLRAGPDEVDHFSALYKVKWPKLSDVSSGLGRGWQDGRCLYFDAIEMADLYIPLP